MKMPRLVPLEYHAQGFEYVLVCIEGLNIDWLKPGTRPSLPLHLSDKMYWQDTSPAILENEHLCLTWGNFGRGKQDNIRKLNRPVLVVNQRPLNRFHHIDWPYVTVSLILLDIERGAPSHIGTRSFPHP